MTLFNLVKKCVIKWCVTFYFTNWINFPNRIEPPSAWRIHRVALLTNSGGEKESNGMRPNRTASASSRVSPTQVENGGRSRRCVLSSIAGARKETEGSAALISNNQLSPPPLSLHPFSDPAGWKEKGKSKKWERAPPSPFSSGSYQDRQLCLPVGPHSLLTTRSTRLLALFETALNQFRTIPNIHPGISSQPKNNKNLINSSLCDCDFKFRIWILVFIRAGITF